MLNAPAKLATQPSQQHLLVRLNGRLHPAEAGWDARTVGVEELALAYLRETPLTSTLAPVEVGR